MGAPDDRHRQTFDLDGLPMRPSFIEFDAIDRRYNIDTARDYPDLENQVGPFEILDRQSGEWRAKSLQGPPDALGVLIGATNPDIQVARGPRQAVCRQRIRTDHQKLSVFDAQRGQHVAEVGIQQRFPP